MSLERRIAKGRECPRKCGGTLLNNTYNPKSVIDGLQVCLECFIKESIDGISKSLGEDERRESADN